MERVWLRHAHLGCIANDKGYPLHITHPQFAASKKIMSEVQRFDPTQPDGQDLVDDGCRLRATQELALCLAQRARRSRARE